MTHKTQIFSRVVGAAAAVLVAFTAQFPVLAQDVEVRAIERKNIEKGKTTLSEERGYIFLQAPARINGAFLKTPDQEDFDEFEAEWREELAEAKEKYPRRLKWWESRKAMSRDPGDKPVEPTEETFSIGQIDTRLMIFVGPQYVYDKGKDASGEKFFQYLHEVDPGEYTYYGPIVFSGEGVFGVCNCMGSVRFEVKAGEITSVGDMMMGLWADDDAMRQATPFWEPIPDRIQAPIDFTTPANLNQLPVVEAEFHAAGKINNFYRIGVGRLAPMEGVLRYERDTVIDVRAELIAEEEARVKAEAVSAAQTRLAGARAIFDEADAKARAAEAVLAEDETPENQASAEAAINASGAAEIEMIRAEEALDALKSEASSGDIADDAGEDVAETVVDALADEAEETLTNAS